MGVQSYLGHMNPVATPQTQPVAGREAEMVRNDAGGYTFAVDDWTRLDRWLILGSDGGTYYADERTTTLDNAQVLRACIAADGLRTVARIVEISDAGRAPRNDPAILALALCAKTGDEQTRKAAYVAMPHVCRIGTHLFSFAEAVQSLGGWGRGARRSVGRWYTERDPDSLAYQLVKYRQRNGWTHRDLLRLSHPRPNGLLAWAAGKDPQSQGEYALPRVVEGFAAIQATTDPKQAAALILEYDLPREAVPTELLNEPAVWEALLAKMPLTAMIRNLGNMTKLGVVKPFSEGTAKVVSDLGNAERLRKSRVHPMAILFALKTYASGQGIKGASTWSPVSQVVDALDAAFYASMGNVAPTGKRHILGVDTSRSMGGGYYYGSTISGYPMAPVEAAAAMALVTASVEPNTLILGFDTRIFQLNISPRMRLDAAVRECAKGGGGTDCSLPYRLAEQEKLQADAIVVYTDNQTWAGNQHPAQALASYRRTVNPQARSVCAAFTAVGYSIGDKEDPLSLDCVGLDASIPELIRSFVAGDF
jgi:60 kDa SS-A/Ro ribonucleoprotein